MRIGLVPAKRRVHGFMRRSEPLPPGARVDVRFGVEFSAHVRLHLERLGTMRRA